MDRFSGGRSLPYVFDRFHQADQARSDHHAGLGLAIVRELVQDHEGEVSVHSSAADGTTFTVVLPTTLQADVHDLSEDPNDV